MIILIKRIFLIILFFSISRFSISQASLVPAEHQVYEWLHYQRVLGNLGRYSYETLPLMRGQIVEHLEELVDKKLSKTDQNHLHYYLREFSKDSLIQTIKNTYTQGFEKGVKKNVIKKINLLFSSKEPHLYAFSNKISYGAIDFLSGTRVVQVTGSRYLDQNLKGITQKPKIYHRTYRFFGTLYDKVGYHLEFTNPITGGKKQLIYDPYWRETFDAARGKENTLYVQGFTSFHHKNFSVHIGNGNIKYGLKGDESLILRTEGGNFDWLRLNYDSKYIQYTFMKGSLQGPATNIVLPEFNNASSRVSPLRWLALRRLQITPWKWMQMSFTEMLIYSNRPLDISYLNPIYPLRAAEYNNNDRDNPVWFFDGWIRPVRGIELYGSLGIDDLLGFSDIFKKTGKRSSNDAVVSYQIGAHYAHKWGIEFNAEYIYIDPFFYTHWQVFNSYNENGIDIANDLGPNGDQFHFAVKKWLPNRSWIEVYTQKTRKGLNIVDAQGNLIKDVGGDIFVGQNGDDKVLFLDGDIQSWQTYGLRAHTEPFRGFALRLEYQVRNITSGNRIGELSYFELGVELNFYPFISQIPGINKIFSP